MLKNLPPKIDLETKKVLKKAIQANRALAKLIGLHRETASKYLKLLENIGILKSGKSKFFINIRLFALLKRGI